jgi:hypothetical protein
MSRKGRLKRSKIPTSTMPAMSNGARKQALPGSGVGEEGTSLSSLPDGGMVEATSSPRASALRPQAPALNLSVTPMPVANSSRSTERDEMNRDDASVPPVDLDTGFFAGAAGPSEASFEVDTRDPRAAMKLTAAAASRRAHLTKYVTAAVALASVLCVAALVKSSVARSHEALARPHSSFAAQAAAALPPAVNTAPTTEAVPSPLPVDKSAPVASVAVAEGPPSAPAEPAPAPTPAADPGSAAVARGAPEPAVPEPTVQAAAQPAQGAAATPPESASPSPAPPVDPKALAKEAGHQKAKSRGALERGNMPEAIAAGERAVAIDPADAESWLILGAAYQQKGDAKNALRSFKACVSEGKRGPKYECAAMLR